MAGFAMCAACQAEYDDPADRRFHAQPNACPDVRAARSRGATPPGVRRRRRRRRARRRGRRAARRARSSAVKGIGGYHLAVDATDAAAVRRAAPAQGTRRQAVRGDGGRPRRRRRAVRARRPARSPRSTSPRRPIVLAPAPRRRRRSPTAVAPGLPELGVFLPYRPLHHLLRARASAGPLVMTSGNLSDEPIAHDDDDAVAGWARWSTGSSPTTGPSTSAATTRWCGPRRRRLQVLRRSRGLRARADAAARSRAARAGAGGRRRAEEHGRGHPRRRRRGQPPHRRPRAPGHVPVVPPGRRPPARAVRRVARGRRPRPPPGVPVDQVRRSTSTSRPSAVQHHHAHVAACMVEHGRTRPGARRWRSTASATAPDGTLWGGEVLVADFDGFERVGHLRPVPMPGGAAAIREPWRMAAVWARARRRRSRSSVRGVDAAPASPTVRDLAGRPATLTDDQHGPAVRRRRRAPRRAARRVSYEAQAAIELEASARRSAPGDAARPTTGRSCRRGRRRRARPRPGAARGPASSPSAERGTAVAGARGRRSTRPSAAPRPGRGRRSRGRAASTRSCSPAACSRTSASPRWSRRCSRAAGLRVLVHARVPPNDGGISIGQAADRRPRQRPSRGVTR